MMLSNYNHAEKLQNGNVLQAYNRIFVQFVPESWFQLITQDMFLRVLDKGSVVKGK